MPVYPGRGNYYRPSMFGGFQFFPPVIRTLLLINAAVFIILGLGGKMFSLGGIPLEYVFNYYLGLMPWGHGFYPWQLITYQFMHADFLHLLYNMSFGLWIFGMEVEPSVGIETIPHIRPSLRRGSGTDTVGSRARAGTGVRH